METGSKNRPGADSLQGRVGVIDGDQGIRDSLVMLLRTLGVDVETYPSAEAFLEAFDTQMPAAVIVEMNLPGMGGLELKRVLNRRCPELPAIGLTSEVHSRDLEEARDLGFLELVEKPFVFWSVIALVQEILENGSPG